MCNNLATGAKRNPAISGGALASLAFSLGLCECVPEVLGRLAVHEGEECHNLVLLGVQGVDLGGGLGGGGGGGVHGWCCLVHLLLCPLIPKAQAHF